MFYKPNIYCKIEDKYVTQHTLHLFFESEGQKPMEIAAELAQRIVVSMKEIIHQELNFINIDGVIIASTDDDRIGATTRRGKKSDRNENRSNRER